MLEVLLKKNWYNVIKENVKSKIVTGITSSEKDAKITLKGSRTGDCC